MVLITLVKNLLRITDSENQIFAGTFPYSYLFDENNNKNTACAFHYCSLRLGLLELGSSNPA